MTMKRKRRRSRDAMERTELSREATRLLREVQYLQHTTAAAVIKPHGTCGFTALGDLLCDFEDPQQPDTPEHREAQRCHGPCRQHDHLQDAAQHHEEVETVKEGHEIRSGSQSVHLHEHLKDKQHQKHTAGDVCRDIRGGRDERVERRQAEHVLGM